MTKLDYKTDVSIDDSALDVEWLQQAELTMKYCRIEAEARQALDDAKRIVDIVTADLDSQIRERPGKYGLEKITEKAIANVILAQEDYKEANKEVAEAQYELNMAQAAVRAIYAKKDALENLVKLHGQQYFAGPKVPRDLSKEWEQRQRQINSNKKVKISRKRKK